ncbi:MAG: DNA-binding response regulator, partial [Planctomycetota bacterium]
MTERSIPTVYVIDDDASIRESVTFLLESAGLRVRAFESCEAFLGVEPEAGPGCILLDLRLPAMSGLELQRALVERGERLPIIFITGHGDTASAVRAMKAGAIDFLEKPYAPETLLDAVERAVRMDGAEQARQADRARVSALMDRLSDRERDVLAHVVQGLRSQDIADR